MFFQMFYIGDNGGNNVYIYVYELWVGERMVNDSCVQRYIIGIN